MQYISTHYAENMPLEQIAEEVELSPNYICSLFKKKPELICTSTLWNFVSTGRKNFCFQRI